MLAARPFIEKNFHPTVVVSGYYKVIFSIKFIYIYTFINLGIRGCIINIR
jgi:hypothetical protein